MLSTQAVLELLQGANSDRHLTEADLRTALRREPDMRPEVVGRSNVWRPEEVAAFCEALGLKTPSSILEEVSDV